MSSHRRQHGTTRPRPSDSSASTQASYDDQHHRRQPKENERRTRRRNDEEDEEIKLWQREQEREDPKMVGQWKLGKTIGKGASGRVRLAKHVQTGEKVAVKIVPKARPSGKADPDRQAEKVALGLEREIVLMKVVTHPNVLRLIDVWETNKELFLIMELAEGGELFDELVARGKLHADEARHYFQQIISGVDYMHQFNICHRDLKPENVLLDGDGNVKIADFGMAAIQVTDRLLETSCGSPHYAAPEIVTGLHYHGPPSDIWSCGVILFALLSGTLPFDNPNMVELLGAVKKGIYQMPSGISSAARDLLRRMLVVNPEERITTEEIMNHPWFLQKPPRPIRGAPPLDPPSQQEAERPIANRKEIDAEIMGNLMTLWHGESEEDVVRALLSQGFEWAKVFYVMLYKFRTRDLEHFNMAYDEEEMDDDYEDEITEHQAPVAVRQTSGARKTSRIPPPSLERDISHPPRPLPSLPSPPSMAGSTITTPSRRAVPEIHFQEATPEPSSLRQSQVASQGLWEGVESTSSTSVASTVPDAIDRTEIRASSYTTELDTQEFLHDVLAPLDEHPVETASIISPPAQSPYLQDVEAFISPPPMEGGDQFADAEDDESEMGDLPGSVIHSPFIEERHDPFLRSPTPSARPPLVRPRIAQRRSSRAPHGPPIIPLPRNDSVLEQYVMVERPPAGKENYQPGRVAPPRPGSKSSARAKKVMHNVTHGLGIESSGASVFEADVKSPTISLGGPKLQKRKKVLSVTNSPVSPALSGFSDAPSPKPSWLTSLFQWKSLSYTLQSTENVPSTREASIELLRRCGVSVGVESIDGVPVLRCRISNLQDTSGFGVMKPVRFRVEVGTASVSSSPMLGHSPDLRGHYPTVVSLVMEKGAHSTFKVVYNRLRSFWELDNPRFHNQGLAVRLIPSPMPSPALHSTQALWS